MRASARALAALEVAVRRRRAALARRRARRGSCRGTSSSRRAATRSPAATKTRSSPSASACRFTCAEPGHDHRAHRRVHAPSAHDRRRGAQVLDPRVRARADEDAIDRGCRGSACRARAPCTRARARPRRARPGRRTSPDRERRRRVGTTIPGFVPHVTCGPRVRDVDVELAVERRVGVGRQAAPAVERALPVRALRRAGPALEVGERRLVGRDHPGARARLDRHVADRQAALHRERLDHRACVLDHVADAAADAEPADRGEDDVLRSDAAARVAPRKRDANRARLALRERLGREDVLDLATSRSRTPARRTRRASTCASRRRRSSYPAGVQPQLGADHVDDSLAAAAGGVERYAELLAVPCERRELLLARADRSACRRPSRRCGPSSRPSAPGAARAGRRAAGPRTPVRR